MHVHVRVFLMISVYVRSRVLSIVHVLCAHFKFQVFYAYTVYNVLVYYSAGFATQFSTHTPTHAFTQIILQEIVQHLNIEKVIPSYKYTITVRYVLLPPIT